MQRIRETAQQLAQGNLTLQPHRHGAAEFQEINRALDQIAARLQQTISQAATEQALIESERNKLRGVLNAMTDGVFALDPSGRIILYNKAAAEITGRTIEEVAGQLSEKVMPFRQNGELVMTRFLASRTGNENKVGNGKASSSTGPTVPRSLSTCKPRSSTRTPTASPLSLPSTTSPSPISWSR